MEEDNQGIGPSPAKRQANPDSPRALATTPALWPRGQVAVHLTVQRVAPIEVPCRLSSSLWFVSRRALSGSASSGRAAAELDLPGGLVILRCHRKYVPAVGQRENASTSPR